MDTLIQQAIAYTEKQNQNEALDPITCEAYSFFTNCYTKEEWKEFIGPIESWSDLKEMIDHMAGFYEDRLESAQREW